MKNVSAFSCAVFSLLFLGAAWSSSDSLLSAQDSWAKEILAAHNKHRAELKLPPLAWSETLAAHAKAWADHLASLGGNSLVHSSNESRPNEGENLASGTSGAYSATKLVELWGSEKQYFVNGIFPDVSKTSGWSQVGHYTQIIWRDTKLVGCAKATAGGNDILVCRYSPPGNFMGQKVY
jgi:hypothetical protein